MTDVRLQERRYRASDPALREGARPCRVCLRIVDLEPGFIETTAQHVYVRCPHCGGSFPVRHSDVDALLGRPTPLS